MDPKPPPKLVSQPEHPFRRLQKDTRYAVSKLNRAFWLQLLCCILIIALNAGLLFVPGADRIENFFHDYFFRFRHSISSSPDIAMVEIAEDSIQTIGRWPWPRHYHAVMTHLLEQWGARAVVFDIIFSEPSTAFDDGALIEALKESKNVYLPVVEESKGDQKIWIHPLPEMSAAVKGTGHINIQPDSDGTLRRIRVEIESKNESYPHLAVRVAADLLGKNIRDLHLPVDAHGNLIVNWAGRWKDTFKHFSYVDLLKSFEAVTKGEEPLISPEALKGKICIIGLTAFGHTDIKANPIEPAYPAAGIHANVISSILSRQFLRPAPAIWNIFSIVFLGLFVMALLIRSQSSWSFIYGLGVGVLWVLLSYAVFHLFGLLIGTAHQLITILSVYLFCTGFALIFGHRERNRLFNLATTDGLTGLFVIRHFRLLMNETASESLKRGKPLSMILLDIDHFKKVNDTYGHPAGDMVLKQTAKIIKEHIRYKRTRDKIDYAGRYGGEEFVILLRNCSITDAYVKVAERIRKKIEESEFIWNGERLKVTASLGVSCLRPDEQMPDLMVHRADEALYRAKNEGRNCVRLERS